MKWEDLTSISRASAKVMADGVVCSEYNVVNSDTTISAWISVRTGQTLTLSCGACSATAYHKMDLIVDGIMRGTTVRRHAFTLSRPVQFSTARFRNGNSIHRGEMKVATLFPSMYKYITEDLALDNRKY